MTCPLFCLPVPPTAAPSHVREGVRDVGMSLLRATPVAEWTVHCNCIPTPGRQAPQGPPGDLATKKQHLGLLRPSPAFPMEPYSSLHMHAMVLEHPLFRAD
jgi:hypothetical protein